jgi:hypothetical protein
VPRGHSSRRSAARKALPQLLIQKGRVIIVAEINPFFTCPWIDQCSD